MQKKLVCPVTYRSFSCLQGTQKICLPYSPTKTLSVKSILRYAFTNKLSVQIFACIPFPVIQSLRSVVFVINL